MNKQHYYHAALSATLQSLCTLKFNIHEISCACAAIPAPPSPVATSTNIMKSSASVRVLSGCVRAYPDQYSLYFFLTYYLCPSCPGKNQHTHAHARARGKSIILSDLLFILKLKVHRQLGQLFNIKHFRSDSHTDALGQPGRVNIGGVL